MNLRTTILLGLAAGVALWGAARGGTKPPEPKDDWPERMREARSARHEYAVPPTPRVPITAPTTGTLFTRLEGSPYFSFNPTANEGKWLFITPTWPEATSGTLYVMQCDGHRYELRRAGS